MAQVRIEDIIEYLDSDLRRALEDAVSSEIPGASLDSHSLFRAFVRAVGRRCGTWETVPDSFVKA
jgi:hypothetical protein